MMMNSNEMVTTMLTLNNLFTVMGIPVNCKIEDVESNTFILVRTDKADNSLPENRNTISVMDYDETYVYGYLINKAYQLVNYANPFNDNETELKDKVEELNMELDNTERLSVRWKYIANNLFSRLFDINENDAITFVTEKLELTETELEELGVDLSEKEREIMDEYLCSNFKDYYNKNMFSDYELDDLVNRAKAEYGKDWKDDIYSRNFVDKIMDLDDLIECFKDDELGNLSSDAYDLVVDNMDWNSVSVDELAEIEINETYVIVDDYVLLLNV